MSSRTFVDVERLRVLVDRIPDGNVRDAMDRTIRQAVADQRAPYHPQDTDGVFYMLLAEPPRDTVAPGPVNGSGRLPADRPLPRVMYRDPTVAAWAAKGLAQRLGRRVHVMQSIATIAPDAWIVRHHQAGYPVTFNADGSVPAQMREVLRAAGVDIDERGRTVAARITVDPDPQPSESAWADFVEYVAQREDEPLGQHSDDFSSAEVAFADRVYRGDHGLWNEGAVPHGPYADDDEPNRPEGDSGGPDA